MLTIMLSREQQGTTNVQHVRFMFLQVEQQQLDIVRNIQPQSRNRVIDDAARTVSIKHKGTAVAQSLDDKLTLALSLKPNGSTANELVATFKLPKSELNKALYRLEAAGRTSYTVGDGRGGKAPKWIVVAGVRADSDSSSPEP